MAIIPDFTQLTTLAGTDWLTGWTISGSEMFKISVDDFLDNVIAGNFQPLDSDLTTIAGLDKTAGNIIISNGTDWTVENVGSITRFSTDTSITARGVYLFFGSTPRTVTISDGITGPVEIRTVATADLTLSGNINPAHLGVISQGSLATVFRWSATDNFYTF